MNTITAPTGYRFVVSIAGHGDFRTHSYRFDERGALCFVHGNAEAKRAAGDSSGTICTTLGYFINTESAQ